MSRPTSLLNAAGSLFFRFLIDSTNRVLFIIARTVGNPFLLLRSYNGLGKPNDGRERKKKKNNHAPKFVAQFCHEQAGCDCMERTKKKLAI
jgi:hypothetical protein